ncbi:MAG: hypothetical protein LUE11_01060 [Clostridia bacterium]|nr:hypothetical protein [Clostridia bacterium]
MKYGKISIYGWYAAALLPRVPAAGRRQAGSPGGLGDCGQSTQGGTVT